MPTTLRGKDREDQQIKRTEDDQSGEKRQPIRRRETMTNSENGD